MWRRGFCCQNQRSETSAIQFRKDKWVRRCLQLGYNLTFKSSPNRKASLGGFSNQEKFRRKTFCWLRPFVFSKVVCVQPTRNGCQDIWNSSDLALVVSFHENCPSKPKLKVHEAQKTWISSNDLFLFPTYFYIFGKGIARFLFWGQKPAVDWLFLGGSPVKIFNRSERQKQPVDLEMKCNDCTRCARDWIKPAHVLDSQKYLNIDWLQPYCSNEKRILFLGLLKNDGTFKKNYRKFLLLYSCGFQWRRNVHRLIFYLADASDF